MKLNELQKEIDELKAQKKKYDDYYDKLIAEREEILNQAIEERKAKAVDDFYEDDEIIIYVKASEKAVIDAIKVLSDKDALKLLIQAKNNGKCNVSITKPFQKQLSENGFDVNNFLSKEVSDASKVVIKGVDEQ